MQIENLQTAPSAAAALILYFNLHFAICNLHFAIPLCARRFGPEEDYPPLLCPSEPAGTEGLVSTGRPRVAGSSGISGTGGCPRCRIGSDSAMSFSRRASFGAGSTAPVAPSE